MTPVSRLVMSSNIEFSGLSQTDTESARPCLLGNYEEFENNRNLLEIQPV